MYFDGKTDFLAVRRAAARYVGEPQDKVELKDVYGITIPELRRIYSEIHGELARHSTGRCTCKLWLAKLAKDR